MGDPASTMLQPLEQEGVAQRLDQVRAVIAGRAVDAQADWCARLLKGGCLAAAGGEDHVGGRAMADRGAGPAEPGDLGLVEPDAMGQPDLVAQPAAAFQIVEGPAAEARPAPGLLVLAFRQMGVQAHAMARRQLGRVLHQALGDGERRAGGERDLDHGAVARLMMRPDQPLAIGQDDVFSLDHAARRQAALILGQAHRAAGQDHPQAERPGLRDLQVDRILQARRKQIVVVAGGGAAGEQQLGQRHPHGQTQRLGRELGPDRVECLQPGKQRLV